MREMKFKEETINFCGIKVDVPNPVTIPNHATIFEWYVVQRGSKDKYQ